MLYTNITYYLSRLHSFYIFVFFAHMRLLEIIKKPRLNYDQIKKYKIAMIANRIIAIA
jgi:hypothetical protein